VQRSEIQSGSFVHILPSLHSKSCQDRTRWLRCWNLNLLGYFWKEKANSRGVKVAGRKQQCEEEEEEVKVKGEVT